MRKVKILATLGPASESQETISELLKAVGYSLGYVGKWHVHPVRTPRDYGFDRYVDESAYETWRATRGVPPRPSHNRWFGEVDPFITAEQSRLAWGADVLLHMLEDASRQEAPFFLRWDPSEPHLPNIVPEPYASMYDPADIPPWQGFADSLRNKPFRI